jgi:predicted SprT family Zn-dependent metalloprotease
VHDWHDRQSPAKPLVSPKKQKWREDITKMMDGIALDDESSNEEAPPSPVISPKKKKTPAPKKDTASVEAKEARSQRKDFATNKHAIATAFLEELDSTICSGAIAELTTSTGGIKLVWSKTLKTTAGRANWRREQTRTRTGSLPTDVSTETRHHCSIELAEKVIDDAERLYNVLAHEFCHLTTFMLSNVRNNPHGAEFKSWGRKATTAFADRGVTVTTKHSYAIEYKYVWECVECGYEFKRHSKSIDPARHSCGKCKGVLAQTKPVPRAAAKAADGSSKPKNEYQVFVKDNFKRVKSLLEARGEDAQMGKVMEAVAREYRAAKEEKEREKAKAKAKAESADGLEAALDGLKI